MKKLFTVSGIFMLFLFSQNAAAQEKQTEEKIGYKGDQIKRNLKEDTVTLNGNVMIKTKNFIVNNADKALVDEKNHTITIYNPKDFKLISAKTLSKANGNSKNILVYDSKEESITFQ
ncbi:hypothetical protein [Chryseobacterium sp. GP-SGM7]|uniref:hypothetical protein n=1 Tax=Chryseobacterium sp. GP-SGM7 TaxID=3411323 RepID=UPI003B93D0A9